jgi:hypothetical protein
MHALPDKESVRTKKPAKTKRKSRRSSKPKATKAKAGKK